MKLKLLDCMLDEADSIIDPPLHDSNLTKLEFNEDSVVLSFLLESNKIVNIHLIGIVDVICNNLRKGNIVLDVTVSTGSKTEFYLLDRLFHKPRGDTSTFENYLASLKKMILQKELYFVQLNPSYGCEIIALCKEVKYGKA